MSMKKPLLLLALAACTDPTHPDPVPPTPMREHVMTMTPNLDVLFVIDDSGSMADKQNAFNRAFPSLVAQLASADGGLPNLHLGVVSTDLGTSASGGGTPATPVGTIGQGGCAGVGKGGNLLGTPKYLESNRNGTDNFAGTLAEAFDAVSKLGATGCGFEQQLGAMRMALDANPMNEGFVRPSANLGVIVLSDEDDCSASNPALFGPTTAELGNLDSFRCFRFGVECAEEITTVGIKTQCKPRAASTFVSDVTPYRDFLVGLKQGEARRVMFGAVIAEPVKVEVETRQINGTPNLAVAHACSYPTTSGMAVADPAVRFSALAKALPRATVTSICNDDLTAQATQLGQALKSLVNDTCLPAPLAAGSDCVVTDVQADGTTANIPFEIVSDATCASSQQRVVLQRSQPAAFDTYSTLSCAPPSL